MANRLINRCTASLVSTLPNIRFTAGARAFTSYDEPQSSNGDIIFKVVSSSDTSFQWPDTRLGPLEPKDHRFPLPGLVGSTRLQQRASITHVSAKYRKTPRYDADVLTGELPHERQSSVYEQFMTVNKQTLVANDGQSSKDSKSKPFDTLECVAHDCPFLLRKDFFDMFPNCRIHPLDNLTVITFCRRPDTDDETTKKLGVVQVQVRFTAAANKVCEELHNCGFWADFIDPLSGRPYLGVQTNAAYEVDERYRRFGFEIDDSVTSCRVMRHYALGTRPFVGCVFTSAPVSHPIIIDIAQTSSRHPAATI